MYSVAPLVLRKVLADVRVGQVTIPAGTAILIHVFAMHNTSANYERHAEFLPVGFCRGVPPLHPGQDPRCPKCLPAAMQVGTDADSLAMSQQHLDISCAQALLLRVTYGPHARRSAGWSPMQSMRGTSRLPPRAARAGRQAAASLPRA